MKKTFVFAASIMVVTLISFACKKSTTTPSTNTTTSTTGSNTTPIASYSVNGVDQTGGNAFSLVKGPSTSPNVYEFILVGGSGGWGLGVIFSGTVTPASGQYQMEDTTNTVPAGQCIFELTGSNNNGGVATAGTLTVTTGATNVISFNNVLIPQPNGTGGTAATYTVSGNIKY